jgi:ABC-2 type transport system ATP-binding protein
MPVQRAMELAGIIDIAGQKTTKLSGGQSQRVRYALALVPDPALLVLDEPTVAMDVEVRRAFWASMRDYTQSGGRCCSPPTTSTRPTRSPIGSSCWRMG